MPPSPALKISPGRELRADSHKRGRSLESGIILHGREDDLALFNEVKNKEKENFLLQSNDDFDDLFSTKLKRFSDSKAGVSNPSRGESSDLLNEGDKNDYDWLITPPESPLFASLDDEAPAFHHVQRGRPRSQPVPISRSSMVERGYRSARGSPSPNRLSPSLRSGNTVLQPRSRPFSASQSSPPPTFVQTSPSRRLSPPPSKPTLAAVSGAPIPRRLSTGSLSATQTKTRGISPVRISAGNSASPKIKAWQSNIPGFSCEVPPNLRTSLADRPASYVRGSSPASRNGSRSGRQSMSPASRSVSSSHSHERDPFSSHSKGSVASSGDDDVDSLLSNPVISSVQSVPINIVALANDRVSKKPAKIFSGSAPKRRYDFALRQMESKSPQNMFRPLLSSVPSSTLYAGKGSTQFRSLASRNSSITTSSNTSSDPGICGAFDIEEGQQNRGDVSSPLSKKLFPLVDDDVFVVDQADVSDQDDNPSSAAECHGQVSDSLLDGSYANMDGAPVMEACSQCHRKFHTIELVIEGDQWLCQKCKSSEANPTSMFPAETMMTVDAGTTESCVTIVKISMDTFEHSSAGETETAQVDHISGRSPHPYCVPIRKDLAASSTEELSVDGEFACKQKEPYADIQEGNGISLLLKRSSSAQGRIVVPSRSYTASNTSYDDFSYARDSLTSLRSSIGHSSVSMSSSLDLGRQTEPRIRRQPGGSKSDMENYRYEVTTKHERSASSTSGASGSMSQIPSIISGSLEDGFRVTAVRGVTCLEIRDHSLNSECTEAESTCTDVESGTICKTTCSGDNLMLSVVTPDEPPSPEKGNKLTRNSGDSTNEDNSQSPCLDLVDAADVSQPGTLDATLEMGIKSSGILSADSQSDFESTNSKNRVNEMAGHGDHIREEPGVSDAGNAITDDRGTPKSRNLEEATDVILLCSSIVHEIAYNAANIAINRENSSAAKLRPAPAPAFPSRSSSDGKEKRSRTSGRRSSKSHKTRLRKSIAESKSPQSVLAENEGISPPRIVMSPAAMGSSSIPPKLESKCNCSIM